MINRGRHFFPKWLSGKKVSAPAAFILSFLLWCFCFKTFLLNRSYLAFDAPPSYDHIKFFIDNIIRGVIPLWDYYEANGAPNSFFLRRMGEFNPVYLLIIGYRTLGLSHTHAYLLFLASYFFVGMLGFYCLAKKLFNNKTTAFIAYLLIMFSSLGTRLFDSHIMFTAIPIIWFFYFLIAFTKEQQRSSFLGVIFCSMIILTTYIPFYFVLIFFSFALTFALFYFKDLKNIFLSYLAFLNKNKLFSGLCIFALLVSLYPGYSFYKEGKSGNFVMPVRHNSSGSSNQISVGVKDTSERSITRELYVTFLFKNLKKIKFKVVYLPIFAYMILFLCLFNKTTKLSLFLFSWGSLIFILSSTSLPIHSIFYKYIFFFKFFRNFHFFLWLALLPIFVLFIAEQLNTILNAQSETKGYSRPFYSYIALIHVAFLLYFLISKDTLASSYVALVLSALFFVLLPYLSSMKYALLFLLVAMITIQPLEVFKYFSINETITPRKYIEDTVPRASLEGLFPEGHKRMPSLDQRSLLSENNATFQNLYYGTSSYSLFLKLFSPTLYSRYSYYRFYLYDQILNVSDNNIEAGNIADSLNNDRNLAFVSSDRTGLEPEGTSNIFNSKAQPVTENSQQFRIIKFDANSVRIETDFPERKFLVFTDPFHEKWQASINNKRASIYRTNIAFKGLWIPAGKNTIFIRYGSLKDYTIEYFIFLIFYCCFGSLIFLSFKQRDKT